MRYFVSAGWPYLYDVPGLHNCVPMLFADVTARFLRSRGDEVFYLCGGDEHGSRVEFVAKGLGKRPQELVDEKYRETVPLLKAMGISVDSFGRTSDPRHKEFVRSFLLELRERGKVSAKPVEVPYCPRCSKHLPDRFLQGRCPHCGDTTYGGQCGNKRACGKMIASMRDGRCALCGETVEFRAREHWVLPVSPYRLRIMPHVGSDRRNQAEVVRRVEETFRDIPEVTLTRDTSWGIPLVESERERTVYSWADSLLAKISGAPEELWKDAATRKLFFLGMDGVPFYGVLLPSLLLAAEKGHSVSHWTLLPNEVLIYEGGVCSKSTGTGIWLKEALSVLEGDFWRFHIYYTYARAEKHADFRWERFVEAVNTLLIHGLEESVTRAVAAPSAGEVDRERLGNIRASFAEVDTAGAFRRTLELVIDPGVSRATLLEAMPLLGCFIPRIAERALRRLEGSADRIFDGRPLSHQELRVRYQALVDERRDRQTLQEEVTNLRADSLCVCPINLKEQ
ncbi:MAG: class I tRNA ligase family protein [Planctomycetes bacterium]|nr:class I tRNA ligase family protein [Planctomycetota bacterium]